MKTNTDGPRAKQATELRQIVADPSSRAADVAEAAARLLTEYTPSEIAAALGRRK